MCIYDQHNGSRRLSRDYSVHKLLLTACVRQKIRWAMTHCELRCLHVEILRNHLVPSKGQWPLNFCCYALGHRREVSVG